MIGRLTGALLALALAVPAHGYLAVPALGYDAALLLLEGIRSGASSPRAVRAAMERIRGLEGANGVYSVVAGQVVRRTQVVRLDHGVVLPVG